MIKKKEQTETRSMAVRITSGNYKLLEKYAVEETAKRQEITSIGLVTNEIIAEFFKNRDENKTKRPKKQET